MKFGRVGFRMDAADRDAELVKDTRIKAARGNPHWTELEENALVPRQWWLVHSDTDELFQIYRGAPVFARPGSAQIEFQNTVPMWFFVNRDHDVVFLERCAGTWSQVVAKRARRSGAAA